MKLNHWLSVWLEKYTKHTIKLRTYTKYKYIIDKHINPLLGDYDLAELNGKIIQDFVLDKLENGNLKTQSKLAHNTIIGIVNVLKSGMNLAKIFNKIQNDEISKIKLPTPTEKPVTAFEKHEQEKIEKYCLASNKSNYIGIVICLYTGIRLGELLALTWEDINFHKGIMQVTKTAYKLKEDGVSKIVIDTPKTKSSIRLIPIPKTLLHLLKNIKRKSSTPYIIATRSGGMVAPRCYQRTFGRILHKIGVPYKNFHSLRHTFATRAIEMGMDVKTLSEILGHKNPVVTLTRYTHSLLPHKITLMNKLGKSLIV